MRESRGGHANTECHQGGGVFGDRNAGAGEKECRSDGAMVAREDGANIECHRGGRSTRVRALHEGQGGALEAYDGPREVVGGAGVRTRSDDNSRGPSKGCGQQCSHDEVVASRRHGTSVGAAGAAATQDASTRRVTRTSSGHGIVRTA